MREPVWLALILAEVPPRLPDRFAAPLVHRDAVTLVRALGERLLLAEIARGQILFCASATLSTLEADEGPLLRARLTRIEPFVRHVPAGTAPGEGGILMLTEDRFEAILARGASARDQVGFAEAQAPFARVSEALAQDTLHDQALELYGRQCAFTGSTRGLELATIRPIASGGMLEIDNVILARSDAKAAFENGHLSLGRRGEFIAALDQLDPELLEQLNPIGRLRLPVPRRFGPSERNLRFHRRHVFSPAQLPV